MRYFDSDLDGSLNYNDFLQLVLPCDEPDLRSGLVIRDCLELADENGGRVNEHVEEALTALLEREIVFNRRIEELKQRLAATKTFDVGEAFHAIDDWNYNYIDRKNLRSFFRKHGVASTRV